MHDLSRGGLWIGAHLLSNIDIYYLEIIHGSLMVRLSPFQMGIPDWLSSHLNFTITYGVHALHLIN